MSAMEEEEAKQQQPSRKRHSDDGGMGGSSVQILGELRCPAAVKVKEVKEEELAPRGFYGFNPYSQQMEEQRRYPVDPRGYMGLRMAANPAIPGSPEIRAQQRRVMGGGAPFEAVDTSVRAREGGSVVGACVDDIRTSGMNMYKANGRDMPTQLDGSMKKEGKEFEAATISFIEKLDRPGALEDEYVRSQCQLASSAALNLLMGGRDAETIQPRLMLLGLKTKQLWEGAMSAATGRRFQQESLFELTAILMQDATQRQNTEAMVSGFQSQRSITNYLAPMGGGSGMPRGGGGNGGSNGSGRPPPPSGRVDGVCDKWRTGSCQRGENCRFKHEMQAGPR